jgi:hypothetical protein
MARFKDSSRLLQILAETPVVSFACKKIGLDRTTFYRWYKDNLEFRQKVDEIMRLGRIAINDMAEASIIKEINDGNMRANIFWLQHNHPAYRPVRTSYVDPISIHKHELMPGETCSMCGFREAPIPKYEKGKDKIYDNKALARELYTRLRFMDKHKQSYDDVRQIIDDFIEEKNVKNTIEIVNYSATQEQRDELKRKMEIKNNPNNIDEIQN